MNIAEFLQAAKPKSDDKECITLRDHFAMAALSGYMSTDSHHFDDSAEWAARHAYEVADAMLKERGK